VTDAEESSKIKCRKMAFFVPRRLRLVQRRTLWCPTWVGSLCLVLFLAAPAIWWGVYGEAFLSLTDRRPAEILVVEGWIGRDGVQAAAKEFVRHGYRYVITTGGLTSAERWDESSWSYAEGAQHELIRSGIPETQIIAATSRVVDRQRTFECAVAASRALQSKGIHARSLNVFTWGPHARRSRLVFAKVFQPDTDVGIVSWSPSTDRVGPWWHSSDRAKELLAETPGYFYEAFFNSGRPSNSIDKDSVPVNSGRSVPQTKMASPLASP
jgi:hypothetical protein